MKISFVIPVYNEKDSLEELYNEIVAGVGSKTYEIIFIDDGSTDGSVNIIEQLAKMDSNVIVIQFYRNYGKSAALSEGFKHAEGDCIITMDADLQDDPAEVDSLLLKLTKDMIWSQDGRKIVKIPYLKNYLQNFSTLLREFSQE